MVALQLPEDVMEQLQAIAEREQRSPAEVVADLLKQYPSSVEYPAIDESQVEPGSMKALGLAAQRANIGVDTERSEAPRGTLAALAQSALEAGLRSGITDTSERSREILNTEYADYLKKRMQDSDDAKPSAD